MKTCVICSTSLQGLQQKYCSNKCKQKDHYHKVKKNKQIPTILRQEGH